MRMNKRGKARRRTNSTEVRNERRRKISTKDAEEERKRNEEKEEEEGMKTNCHTFVDVDFNLLHR